MPTFKKSTQDNVLIHSSGARGTGNSSSKQGGARGPKERPQQPPKR